MIKVEIRRGHNGHVEQEVGEFITLDEARQWAQTMRRHYGYRKIWIDGVEYNGA